MRNEIFGRKNWMRPNDYYTIGNINVKVKQIILKNGEGKRYYLFWKEINENKIKFD
jgi:hypothetical protein